MTRKLTVVPEISSAAPVLRYAANEIHDAFTALLGKIVQRVSALSSRRQRPNGISNTAALDLWRSKACRTEAPGEKDHPVPALWYSEIRRIQNVALILVS